MLTHEQFINLGINFENRQKLFFTVKKKEEEEKIDFKSGTVSQMKWKDKADLGSDLE